MSQIITHWAWPVWQSCYHTQCPCLCPSPTNRPTASPLPSGSPSFPLTINLRYLSIPDYCPHTATKSHRIPLLWTRLVCSSPPPSRPACMLSSAQSMATCCFACSWSRQRTVISLVLRSLAPCECNLRPFWFLILTLGSLAYDRMTAPMPYRFYKGRSANLLHSLRNNVLQWSTLHLQCSLYHCKSRHYFQDSLLIIAGS